MFLFFLASGVIAVLVVVVVDVDSAAAGAGGGGYQFGIHTVQFTSKKNARVSGLVL